MTTITLPPNYSLVGLGLGGVVLLNIWQMSKVGNARKAAGVAYPTMLVPEAEAKADKKKHIYNCVQRAHGNTLENSPFVLALTAYLGLFNPVLATVASLAYATGRIFYTTGYASGKPEARINTFAVLQYPGLISLVFGTLYYSAVGSYKYYTA